MSTQKVVSLTDWKNKDAAELLEYLKLRLAQNDLPGLLVQTLDRRGQERIHLTGVYKHAPEKAIGTALVRITAAASGTSDDPTLS